MNNKRTKVIVAGHACIDITPVFPDKQMKKDTKEPNGYTNASTLLSKVLIPGKLVQMNGVDINLGGAVSNTGLAMKLLGEDVALAAKIGDDSFGDILTGIYEKYGTGAGIIRCPGERTSYSVVLAVPGVDRIFLHDPGANDTFDAEDVKKLDFSDVKLFHFGYPPIMEKMYQNEGEELLRIFQYVKEQGVLTSMDMTMVDETSKAGQTDWDVILRKVLPYVDFFLPSVEETCFMLDKERYREWCERAKGEDLCMAITPEDVKPLADKLISYGAKVVLLKCGAPGLYYKTGGSEGMKLLLDQLAQVLPKCGTTNLYRNKNMMLYDSIDISNCCDDWYRDWTNQEGFERSYKPAKVLSGTGAGDTTIAAFLTAVLRGCGLHKSIQLATAEGASCVEDYGALGGIKSLETLEERINKGWEKNDVSKHE